MRKKLLSYLLMVCMVVSFVPVKRVAAKDFTIDTQEKFVEFVTDVNSGNDYQGYTVTLTTDIDISKIDSNLLPIGSRGPRDKASYTGNAFRGTFDGGYNHILNFTYKNDGFVGDEVFGLFGIVDNGTVKNLTLQNVSLETNCQNIGAAIGMMINNATASNITVSGEVTGGDGVGGVVGRLVASGTIKDCTNSANVTAVKRTDGPGEKAGGIVGAAYYGWEYKGMIIENCTNSGTVNSENFAGGIVGYSSAVIERCRNTGQVNTKTGAGGIVGHQYRNGDIRNCDNTGIVSCSSDTGGSYYGGIVGCITTTGTYDTYISVYGCSSSGKVGLNSTATDIGGIAGLVKATSTRASIDIANNISTAVNGENVPLKGVGNQSGNGTYTVEEPGDTWTAQVGNNHYLSLQNAINAGFGSIHDVVLFSDVNLDETVDINGSVKLDLKNCTVTAPDGAEAFHVEENSGLLIKDSGEIGTISGPSDQNIITVNGNLEIQSGHIKGLLGVAEGAKVSISGGTFTVDFHNEYLAANHIKQKDAENNTTVVRVYTATFILEPASATVKVTKENGETINPKADYPNVYEVPAARYNYEVSAENYVPKRGTFTIDASDLSKDVSLAGPVEVTIPELPTATYGQKLSDIRLPDGWTWNAPDTSVGDAGEKTFPATYTQGDVKVNAQLSVTVTMDKSSWGTAVTNNGVTNYVSSDGTTAVEVDKKGSVWLKAGSGDETAWFGLDNSAGIFRLGSKLWVRNLNSENAAADWVKYYAQMDDEHKALVDSGKLMIFLIGITDPDGKEYTTDLGGSFPVYVQIDGDWSTNNLQALYIVSGATDEVVNVSCREKVSYPGGESKFAVLTLTHFSPYALYDKVTGTSTDGSQTDSQGQNTGSPSYPNEDADDATSDDDSDDDQTTSYYHSLLTGDQINYLSVIGIACLMFTAGVLIRILTKKKSRFTK